MNASQRASWSSVTHSFGWCACAMCPGPQITAGTAALWNSAASVPNDTLPHACVALQSRPSEAIALSAGVSKPGSVVRWSK